VAIVMGVSGCGKTTIGKGAAEKLGFAFADGDDFHSQANKDKMHAGHPLTDEDRLPWLETLAGKIKEWLSEGQNTILACSALKEWYRKILVQDPDRVAFVFLDGSYELFSERLVHRNHPFMNNALLKSQFDTLEKPKDAIYINASQSLDENIQSTCDKLKAWMATK
jgi:gluconokinase